MCVLQQVNGRFDEAEGASLAGVAELRARLLKLEEAGPGSRARDQL